MLVTLDGRKRRVAFDAGLRQHIGQRRSAACRRRSRARPASAPPAAPASSRARSRWRRATASPTRRSRSGYVLTCQSVPKGEASSSITTPEATGLRRTLHAIENGQLLRHRRFCGGGKLWPGESRGSMNMPSAVHVFGDSLVDSGNVLKLAEFVDDLPLSSLPDGTRPRRRAIIWGGSATASTSPTSSPTSSSACRPFRSSRSAMRILSRHHLPVRGRSRRQQSQLRLWRRAILDGGVPDLDDQTDAYRDAVDRHVDPNALHPDHHRRQRYPQAGPGQWRDRRCDDRAILPAEGGAGIAGGDQRADRHRRPPLRRHRHSRRRHRPDYDGLVDEAARRTAATNIRRCSTG